MPVNDIENMDGEETIGIEEVQYATFCETYKIITFAMQIGMIYPDLETARRRFVCILVAFLTIAPVSCMIFLDMYKSWLRRDLINIIRHCTIVGPFLGIFCKMLILFYKQNTAKQLIDKIDMDYALYNHRQPSHKAIVNTHLQNNILYIEKCWTFTVFYCVLTFPVMAIGLNIYNSLFKDEPTKYMVHDVNKPNAPPEDRFESPFFEVMFVYMCYCCVFYIVNFTGFDGFFGLTINHACLKMDLYCKGFEDAMKVNDKADRHKKLVNVIKEQNKMFEFVDLIQETFNIWLGLVLVATMIQICNCMYHITEGGELDPKYIIFTMGTIVHIYLPCQYSAKLKHMSLETATKLYCGGWERVYDVSTRRTVLIMIARGQTPLEITAFNLLVFDMDLFVSIMKTSYSMYTLLRS